MPSVVRIIPFRPLDSIRNFIGCFEHALVWDFITLLIPHFERGSLLLLRSLGRRPTLLLRSSHLPPGSRADVAFLCWRCFRGGSGTIGGRSDNGCARALRWTAPAFRRSLEGFDGSIQLGAFGDQQGNDVVGGHSFDSNICAHEHHVEHHPLMTEKPKLKLPWNGVSPIWMLTA